MDEIQTDENKISLGMALIIYFGSVAFAMAATAPHLGALKFAGMFPIGLWKYFSSTQGAGILMFVLPYFIYFWLFLLCLATRRSKVFWGVVTIHLICLMMNVSGCRSMQSGF